MKLPQPANISIPPELRNGVFNLIAPRRCLECLAIGSWFCPACRERIIWRNNLDAKCLHCSSDTGRPGDFCTTCQRDLGIVGIYYVGRYQTLALQRGVQWLKFKGIRELAPLLAWELLPVIIKIAPLPELVDSAVIVPLPLHQRRFRQRGFNQSELLAKHLSSYTNIPVLNLLMRKRATWSQAQLPHEVRGENMKGAFTATEVNIPISCTIAIILDDVTTTGSTLIAAARALSPFAFKRIYGLTLAKG